MAAYVCSIYVLKKTLLNFPIKYNFINNFNIITSNNISNHNIKHNYSTLKTPKKLVIESSLKNNYDDGNSGGGDETDINEGDHNITIGQQINSVAESLASKGFLRSHKPYQPPANVKQQINNILKTLNINKNTIQVGGTQKYEILNVCFQQFQHGVPNSSLYEINTIDDIVEFYKTPVNTITPYDAMKEMKLPENLHIQYEYLRFHPDTDQKFNGKSAFTKSSTLVTGLKYKNKYRGHIAKRSWP